MNLVLGAAEETIHSVDVNDDGQPQPPKVCQARTVGIGNADHM
jgi:hypothetical protein